MLMVHVNLTLEYLLLAVLKLTYKKALLGMVAIILLVAMGVTMWLLWPKPDTNSTPVVAFAPIEEVATTALNYSEQQDIAGGLAYYDSQINGRKNEDEKYQLLLYKSSFALDAKKYDEAINAAKSADAIKNSPGAAVALARAYQGKGEKQQAITYYKKALELSPKEGMGARYNATLEQEIKELES